MRYFKGFVLSIYELIHMIFMGLPNAEIASNGGIRTGSFSANHVAYFALMIALFKAFRIIQFEL